MFSVNLRCWKRIACYL